MACAGAHVDDPVCVRHDRLMVLDDDDGATGVHNPVQQREHGLDIGRVKPNGRLVKDNDAAFLAQVDGKLEPLALASGQGGQRLTESEITEANVRQPRQDSGCGQ